MGADPKQNQLRKATINDLPNKVNAKASLLAKDGSALKTNDQRDGSSGFRFSSLHVEEVGEDKDTEDLDVDGYEEECNEEAIKAPKGPGSSEITDAEKKRLDDDVVVACSHPSLVEGLKAKKPLGQEVGHGLISVSQKITKEKALRDVTNKLEPKPFKLKPSWTGPKKTNGPNTREAGIVKERITHGPNGTGQNGNKEDSSGGGPTPSRPPDPGLPLDSSAALAGKILRQMRGMVLGHRARKALSQAFAD